MKNWIKVVLYDALPLLQSFDFHDFLMNRMEIYGFSDTTWQWSSNSTAKIVSRLIDDLWSD